MTKYYAADSFHLSGVGMFHAREELGEDVPDVVLKDLLKKNLITDEKPVERKAKSHAPENKMATEKDKHKK